MSDKFKTWEEAVVWLRSHSDKQKLVYSCYYDDPILDAAERYYSSSEWRAVQNIIGTGGAGRLALDIGAGRGISSYALAKDGWSVTALEPDSSPVVGRGAIHELACAGGVAINIVSEFGEALPFPDSSFDLVHCRQVLHHARNLNQLCTEIGRVLKKGGMLIATREHVISKAEDLPIFLEAHPLHKLYGGENAFMLNDYLDAILHAGIRLHHVFNPMDSDINLFPETQASIKAHWAKKSNLPLLKILPNFVLGLKGRFTDSPGRLYTFVGVKL
jgi:SAM-dependent methyltransferase